MATSQYKAIVIGGSAGSYAVVSKIVAALPPDFPLPVIICMHRLKHVRAGFVEALNDKSQLNVIEPYDKQPVERGNVYVAPANYHLFVEYDATLSLSIEEPHLFCRPAIDHTLSSAAKTWRDKLIGIILTGANKDGAQGLKDIADRGGYTIVQDPATADVPTMPRAALRLLQPSATLPPQGIIDFLKSIR
ncbi:MAG: chemotaxis protein CheB [Bacteroidales bacterium]|nr:chemotaxis protein CheB [Bacteroidales bacterium]